MSERRLDGLALMLVHRDVEVDVEAVIDVFAHRYRTQMALVPRRMLMA